MSHSFYFIEDSLYFISITVCSDIVMIVYSERRQSQIDVWIRLFRVMLGILVMFAEVDLAALFLF